MARVVVTDDALWLAQVSRYVNVQEQPARDADNECVRSLAALLQSRERAQQADLPVEPATEA